MSRETVVLLDPFGANYDGATPLQSPLGGTQSATVYLATALAAPPHAAAVTVFNGRPAAMPPTVVVGVTYDALTALDRVHTALNAATLAIVLVNAELAARVVVAYPATTVLLWQHHAPDERAVKHYAEPGAIATLNAVHGHLFVSAWQRDAFVAAFPSVTQTTTPLFVFRNGVGAAFEPLLIDANAPPPLPNRAKDATYASIPHRGLQLWPALRSAWRADGSPPFSAVTYSGSAIWGSPPPQGEAELLATLADDGVDVRAPAGQLALAAALQNVRVLAYPNVKPETSCITLLQALAAGCLAVTTSLGALPETAAGLAAVTLVTPPSDADGGMPGYIRRYVAALRTTLNNARAPIGSPAASAAAAAVAAARAHIATHHTWRSAAATLLRDIVPVARLARATHQRSQVPHFRTGGVGASGPPPLFECFNALIDAPPTAVNDDSLRQTLRSLRERLSCSHDPYAMHAFAAGALPLVVADASRLAAVRAGFALAAAALPRGSRDRRLAGSAAVAIALYDPATSTADARAAAARWAAEWLTVGALLSLPYALPPIDSSLCSATWPPEVLRVGVVSRDVRSHAVAHFLHPLLAHAPSDGSMRLVLLDEQPVDAGYALSDPLALALRSAAAGNPHVTWLTLGAVRDDAAARALLVALALDVLVDVGGHTGDNRLHVVAGLNATGGRAAQKVVSWLGYPGTVGDGGAIDFKLTDVAACPHTAAVDAGYAERLWRLPRGTHAFTPLSTVLIDKSGRPWSDGDVTGGNPIVLAYFGNPSKLSPASVDAFVAALAACPPGTRLALRYNTLRHGIVASAVADAFISRGAPRHALRLGWDATLDATMRAHNAVDLALDAWPYSGESTVCAAAWMGTPTVTLVPQVEPAASHAARAGAAVLTRLGLGDSELVAASVPAFVATVAGLARDHRRRRALHDALRAAWPTSSLGDGAAWAAGFYSALAAIAIGCGPPA